MTDRHVFIDASFWIAYRDSREPDFSRARHWVHELFKKRTRFVITLPVFCEIHAYYARSPVRRAAVLADFWENPIVHFEEITHEDQQNAVALLEQHHDKAFSLCDALSFAVMRRMGLRRVATFDVHFRQFGEFEILC